MEIIIGCLVLLVVAVLVCEHKIDKLERTIIYHEQNMHQPRDSQGKWLPKKR